MACPAFQVPESLLFLRRLHHVTVGRSSFSLRHQNGRSTLLVADSSGTKDYRLLWGRMKCSKLDEASGAATLWPFSLLYFRLWIKKNVWKLYSFSPRIPPCVFLGQDWVQRVDTEPNPISQ